jgi:ABC-2 type transport system permease protein
MLNLIIKDIMVQKKTILFGALYLFFMILAFSNGGGAASFSAGTLALTYLLIQTPCAKDDKSRADYLFNSLPVSRSAIVMAKYVSVLLYIAVAMAEYTIVYFLVKLTMLPIAMAELSLESFVGLLAMAGLFASVYFPIFFKYGYMKTRYVNIVLFATFFAIGSVLLTSIKENTVIQFLSTLLNNQPHWLLGCGVLGILLGVVLASYSLSARFYNRREF